MPSLLQRASPRAFAAVAGRRVQRVVVAAADGKTLASLAPRAPPRAFAGRRPPQRAAVAATADGAVPRRALMSTAALVPLMPRRAVASSARRADVEAALRNIEWPEDPPFSPEDFRRYDESPDASFYAEPRFVTHIDDAAIAAVCDFYGKNVLPPSGKKDAAVLDLCSSWISHYPKDFTAGRVVGLGMVGKEMAANTQLTEYVVQDLNDSPRLPFGDNEFDAATCTVSFDYLTRPFEVMAELHRVLKPGAVCALSFSNRMFPTKAIAVWSATGDEDHARILGSYFHYAPRGGWAPPAAADITRPSGALGALGLGVGGDPMYVVWSRKLEPVEQ